MELKEQLVEQVKTVLSGDYKEEISSVLQKAEISERELIEAYLRYDLDVTAYENEIYRSLPMRAVLYIKYFMKASWHVDRQAAVLRYIEDIQPKTIVDMGFGVPSRYLREYVLTEDVHAVLVDFDESAFVFSEAVLDELSKDWRKKISFANLDMNTHPYPGDFEVYIFQDSIEHVKDCTSYLAELVASSPTSSAYILSLPVGPQVPAHTIAWNSEQEIHDWLESCGLQILDTKRVYVNPEGDLWARQLDEEFYNLVVHCEPL